MVYVGLMYRCMMTISWSWLAYSYHLNMFNLFKGDLNGFTSGFFFKVIIMVFAALLRINFNRFSTDSTDNCVGKRCFYNDFDGQSNFATCG